MLVNGKYRKVLILIILLLGFTLSLQLSYSFWQIESKDTNLGVVEDECINIIYSDDLDFNLIKPQAIKDDDGPRTTPKSIAITNNCSTSKTVEVGLNVLKTSSLDSDKIKVYINGDVTHPADYVSNYQLLMNNDPDILEKRLLYKFDIEPNTIIRLNIRMWLNEYATITDDKNSFYTNYYVTTNQTVIKPTLYEKIIQDNGGLEFLNTKVVSDYSIISTINDGLIKFDNAYYFRGSVLNNYMKINNLLFRILGINPDGSIRLIYINDTLESSYNNNRNKENYLDFKTSNIFTYLNDWYNNNLIDYDKYIISYDFCSDTSYEKYYNKINYGSYLRLFSDVTPSLTCGETDKEYGGIINNKVGLITMDEVAIAGGSSRENNQSYYLYTGKAYYTMSPNNYYYGANMGIVNEYGKLTETRVTNKLSIYPVINIDGSLFVKGSGTIDSPYELDLE